MEYNIELLEAQKIAAGAAELLKTINNERRTVPEELFRRAGLPLLLLKEDEVDIDAWVDIAGSAQNAVDVVDKNGKVLFTVPPVINTRMVSKKAEYSNLGIDRALEDNLQRLRSGHYPMKHAKSLVIATVSPLLSPTAEDTVAVKQWNAILAHYGMGEIGVAAAPTESTGTKSNVSTIFTGEIEE